jgi:hypothetical protein
MLGAGFIWVLAISVNTRLVAHRTDFCVPAAWAFVVGLIWVVVVRRVVLSDTWYTLGAYALGGALATGLVTKFVPKKKKGDSHVQEEAPAVRRGHDGSGREDEG